VHPKQLVSNIFLKFIDFKTALENVQNKQYIWPALSLKHPCEFMIAVPSAAAVALVVDNQTPGPPASAGEPPPNQPQSGAPRPLSLGVLSLGVLSLSLGVLSRRPSGMRPGRAWTGDNSVRN
jgi:hypothetical protein